MQLTLQWADGPPIRERQTIIFWHNWSHSALQVLKNSVFNTFEFKRSLICPNMECWNVASMYGCEEGFV